MKRIAHSVFGILLFGAGCAQEPTESTMAPTPTASVKSDASADKAEPEDVQADILEKDTAPIEASTPPATDPNMATYNTGMGAPTSAPANFGAPGAGPGGPGVGVGVGVGVGMAGPGVGPAFGGPGIGGPVGGPIGGPGIGGPGIGGPIGGPGLGLDPGLGVGPGIGGPGFGGPGFGPGIGGPGLPLIGAPVPFAVAAPIWPWAIGPGWGDDWHDDDGGKHKKCKKKHKGCKKGCKGKRHHGSDPNRPWPSHHDDDGAVFRKLRHR